MQVYREKGNYQARMPIEPKQPKHHRWTVLSRLLGNVVQDQGVLDAANSNEACAKSTCCKPANRQPVREPPGSTECGTNHVGLIMTLKALTLGRFGSRLLCKVHGQCLCQILALSPCHKICGKMHASNHCLWVKQKPLLYAIVFHLNLVACGMEKLSQAIFPKQAGIKESPPIGIEKRAYIQVQKSNYLPLCYLATCKLWLTNVNRRINGASDMASEIHTSRQEAN